MSIGVVEDPSLVFVRVDGGSSVETSFFTFFSDCFPSEDLLIFLLPFSSFSTFSFGDRLLFFSFFEGERLLFRSFFEEEPLLSLSFFSSLRLLRSFSFSLSRFGAFPLFSLFTERERLRLFLRSRLGERLLLLDERLRRLVERRRLEGLLRRLLLRLRERERRRR